MRRLLILVFVLFAVSMVVIPVMAQEPRLLVSKPADGSTGVPVDAGEISVFFSQPMATDSWSVLEVQGCEFPPLSGADPPWRDNQTFVLKHKELKPDTKYGLQLNSAEKKGFKSAGDGTPLSPVQIRFQTGGGQGPKGPALKRTIRTRRGKRSRPTGP